ncbi:2,3-diaminopropionate biosynthesis protein SbnB [Pseudonocardia alni]|uniref:2,3-diaminopropionate biosynthesis protein SbnB n=1 Tax=Pseudonocardia alni TaxID=33907 RepID=UPI0015C74220|nr:2,3-diaminopropionate biosynthesis protein SbnB [Pseudonocardia antarctica]
MNDYCKVPRFAVVPGSQVRQTLAGKEREIVELVRQTYLLYDAGLALNPPSYFLRFPDRPSSRIIALPASLGGEEAVDGMKWISSFPENVDRGIPRASAILVLNDPETGFPYACMESSIVSATRTAASAAVGADYLTRGRALPRRVGFIGAGLIARYVHTFLVATGWEFDEIGVRDTSLDSAAGFQTYVEGTGEPGRCTIHESVGSLIRGSDLIVLATVASAPHIYDVGAFDHHPVVLNVSLRDLSAEVILNACNVVDDIEHCLKADTSPHLAEQSLGNRSFVHGTLADVVESRTVIPTDRTVVFSPFGMGVLDLAVGQLVHQTVEAAGELQVVEGFFHELNRH